MRTIFKLHKKALSVFLSFALLFPIKSSAAENIKNDAVQISDGQTAIDDTDNSLGINMLKGFFSMFSCFVLSLAGLEIREELKYRREIDSLSESFSERFKENAITCRLTKRQEGRMWCWLACLQGLLRYHNINKSQQEIFVGVSNSWFVPNFEHNRNSGLSIYNSKENMKTVGKINDVESRAKDVIFPSMIKEYVEKISNDKLTYQMVYLNKNLSNEGLKQTILEIYNRIDKRPFSLLANHISCGHFINIVEIDADGIMHIEDPAFAKGRMESIDSYVRNFDEDVKKTMNGANGILLGFVTEKGNEINNHNKTNYRTSDSIN